MLQLSETWSLHLSHSWHRPAPHKQQSLLSQRPGLSKFLSSIKKHQTSCFKNRYVNLCFLASKYIYPFPTSCRTYSEAIHKHTLNPFSTLEYRYLLEHLASVALWEYPQDVVYRVHGKALSQNTLETRKCSRENISSWILLQCHQPGR